MSASNETTPEARSAAAHDALASMTGVTMVAREKIAIVLYPGFTALDVVGPHYFLASMMGATVELVTTGDDLSPVESDLGLSIAPTTRLADVSGPLSLLLIPGGSATDGLLTNTAAMASIARLAAASDTIAGVCTGVFVLARLGLLDDHEATTHWVARPALARLGVSVVDQRVVDRGRVMTAAGVTAGIDLAVRYVARQRGEGYARALELQGEYAPEVPFGSGTPTGAGPDLTSMMSDMFAPMVARLDDAACTRPDDENRLPS